MDQMHELVQSVGRGRGRGEHIGPGLVVPGQSENPVFIRVAMAFHAELVGQCRATVRMLLDRQLFDIEPHPVSSHV
ncbi:hypothetical protein C1N81_44810 (plasmid) [Streptomyces sp. SGAir0957]